MTLGSCMPKQIAQPLDYTSHTTHAGQPTVGSLPFHVNEYRAPSTERRAPSAERRAEVQQKQEGTWRVWGVVLDDGGGGAVQLGVHVDVAPYQVALDQQLVLLHVPPAHNQVVFAGDKPARSHATLTKP